MKKRANESGDLVVLVARNGPCLWVGGGRIPPAPGVGNDAAQRAGHLGFLFSPVLSFRHLIAAPQGLGAPGREGGSGAARYC